MTIRTGMQALIAELRGMTDAGVADYDVAGVYYWSDDQLQDRLDDTQNILPFQPLRAIQQVIAGGSAAYYDYRLTAGRWIEQGSSGGSAIFIVRDSTGTIIPDSSYDVNYRSGVVSFTANTEGTAYYADVRVYNLFKAAADVWEWKAANVAKRVDWKTDNHDIKASQEYKHCKERALYYASQGGARAVRMIRSDAL